VIPFRQFDKVARYEELLYRVDSIGYNEVPNPELLEDLRSFIKEDNWLRSYAVILQAYLLLKAGPKIRKSLHLSNDFGALRWYADQNKNYSAAAKWTLANLIINDTGQETETALKLESYKKALRIVSGLKEWTKLKAPVLLHGIISEAPADSAVFNAHGIPGTRYVPVPYRLHAAYRMMMINSVMDYDIPRAVRYCEAAERICHLSLRTYGEAEAYQSTNIIICQSVVAAIRRLMDPKSENFGKTVSRFEDLIEKISDLEKKQELNYLKSREWIASVRAGLAAIFNLNSAEHRQYLNMAHEDMQKILSRYGSNAVFLSADPMYRLAHQTPEEKKQFEQLLEPLRIKEQQNQISTNMPNNQFNNYGGSFIYVANNSGTIAVDKIINQGAHQLNFEMLSKELDQLIQDLQTENPPGNSNAMQIRELEKLKSEAGNKNGHAIQEKLKIAGKWLLDLAGKVGVNYISELLKSHMNA
jgi:hypothetical protein